MTVFKKIIILFILSLLLSSCDDKVKSMPKKQEEYYNFRDEKYQDFYSRFMREVEKRNLNAITPNDSFERPFNEEYIKYINESLDLDIKDDVFFKLSIEKNKSYEERSDTFYSEKDVLSLHQKNDTTQITSKMSKYKICNSNIQVEYLYCIYNTQTGRANYYYFYRNSNQINYIERDIDFYCHRVETKNSDCTLMYFFKKPYNLYIYVSFRKPNDFFHIIQYVESYIYQVSGEHIWQASLNQKSP